MPNRQDTLRYHSLSGHVPLEKAFWLLPIQQPEGLLQRHVHIAVMCRSKITASPLSLLDDCAGAVSVRVYRRESEQTHLSSAYSKHKPSHHSNASVLKHTVPCRGYATRKMLKRDPRLEAAAAHIQNVWRRHNGRRHGLLRIRKMQQHTEARFAQLQESLIRY